MVDQSERRKMISVFTIYLAPAITSLPACRRSWLKITAVPAFGLMFGGKVPERYLVRRGKEGEGGQEERELRIVGSTPYSLLEKSVSPPL